MRESDTAVRPGPGGWVSGRTAQARLAKNLCARCGYTKPARDSGWCRKCLSAARWLIHDSVPG